MFGECLSINGSFLSDRLFGVCLHRLHSRGGHLRFFFRNHSLHFTVAQLFQSVDGEGSRSSEQLVKQDSQRIDICSRVHIDAAHLSLFRTHVGRCPDHVGILSKQGLFSELLIRGFGDPKIDDLGHRISMVQRD